MPGRLEAHLTPERIRFLRFCVVGTGGVVVNLAFVWLGLTIWADLDKEPREAIASALGIVVSVFTNFLLNDWWTWGDRQKGKRKRDFLARVAAYYAASGVALAVQYGTAQVLALRFDVNIYLAQLVGIALGLAFNYAANNRWTFRDRTRE